MGPGDAWVAMVMITHNRAGEVIRSRDHLDRLPERPRIVVVDNASADMAGVPWVLRGRRVVPPTVERGLRLLDARR